MNNHKDILIINLEIYFEINMNKGKRITKDTPYELVILKTEQTPGRLKYDI